VKPIVLSYAAGPYDRKCLHRLEATCRKWGWDCAIGEEPTWRGFGRRLKAIGEMAQTAKAAGFTHAVHVDAFDVICVGPPELKAPDVPLLLAGELGYWPDRGKESEYGYATTPPKTPWRYVHSQFVLDLEYVDWFRNLIQDMDDVEDDQGFLTEAYLQHQYHARDRLIPATNWSMVLDYDCTVIQSIAHCHPWDAFFAVEGDRVRNKVTGTLPLFIHGNGRTNLEWVPGYEVGQ
jgi:hypothetical protein